MKSSELALNPWHERASPLARAAWVVYTLLLAYSGLAPWTGWRDLGLQPFAYLAAPIPRHITTFDLVVNVLAYMPFGALLVLGIRGLGFAMRFISTMANQIGKGTEHLYDAIIFLPLIIERAVLNRSPHRTALPPGSSGGMTALSKHGEHVL